MKRKSCYCCGRTGWRGFVWFRGGFSGFPYIQFLMCENERACLGMLCLERSAGLFCKELKGHGGNRGHHYVGKQSVRPDAAERVEALAPVGR